MNHHQRGTAPHVRPQQLLARPACAASQPPYRRPPHAGPLAEPLAEPPRWHQAISKPEHVQYLLFLHYGNESLGILIQRTRSSGTTWKSMMSGAYTIAACGLVAHLCRVFSPDPTQPVTSLPQPRLFLPRVCGVQYHQMAGSIQTLGGLRVHIN